MTAQMNHQGVQCPVTRYVYWTDTATTPKVGEVVCYDWDNSTVANRVYYVETPSLNNIEHVAGIITVVSPADENGERWLHVAPPDQMTTNGFTGWTNQNVAAGDILGVIPGTRELCKYLGFGAPLIRVTTAVDRSGTAGTVVGMFGNIQISNKDRSSRFTHFRDTMVGSNLSETAELGRYLSTTPGGSDAVVWSDAKSAGALSMTTTTTSNVNLALNGEMFTLADDEACAFKIIAQVNSAAASTDLFVGLSITDVDYWDTLPTDYIGFTIVDGAITFTYVKDGTGGAVADDTLVTVAADTDVELVFIYDGHSNLYVYVDEVAIAVTETMTEIPNNENLTLMYDIQGSAAKTALISFADVFNYYA